MDPRSCRDHRTDRRCDALRVVTAGDEPMDVVEAAAETMLWYLENKGPLPQITAYRIIRDTFGFRCVVEGSRSLDPDVLKAFKALHGGRVRRIGQVWYLPRDLEERQNLELQDEDP